MEKSEIKFVEGMSWFEPRSGAPEFVLGRISIDPQKLIAFLKDNKAFINDKGYFGIDVKKAKSGKTYLSLDTYKKETKSDDPF